MAPVERIRSQIERRNNENFFCCRKCYDEFQNTSIKLICTCGNEFTRQKAQYDNQPNHYCSVECRIKGTEKAAIINCTECNKEIRVHNYKVRNSTSGKHFCNKSCTGKYYTRNKTFGVNRSKFEVWLEEHLPIEFPDIEFDFNNRTEIGYELDIFIPELRVAIEIHGPTHYEPIYGLNRFKQTQELDVKKITLCEAQNIQHHIIDVSKIRNWSPKMTNNHYKEICDVITNKKNEKNEW